MRQREYLGHFGRDDVGRAYNIFADNESLRPKRGERK